MHTRSTGGTPYQPQHTDLEKRWAPDAFGFLVAMLVVTGFCLLVIGTGAWLASTWDDTVPERPPVCFEDEVLLGDWSCHPRDDARYDADLGWQAR